MPSVAFISRLRDLLSTVEATSVLSSAESRMRGLREQLEFACVAMPCDQALVAIEVEAFGRLAILASATPTQSSDARLDLVPTGTPFAHVLAGGDVVAFSVTAADPVLDCVRPLLASSPTSVIVAPIRLGVAPAGGVMLLRSSESGDREVRLAQQLGEVLSLTVESFRTERVLLRLFAGALPDVLGPDNASFGAGLERLLAELRLDANYRRRVRLALTCSKVAARGEADVSLVEDVLDRFDGYFRSIERPNRPPMEEP